LKNQRHNCVYFAFNDAQTIKDYQIIKKWFWISEGLALWRFYGGRNMFKHESEVNRLIKKSRNIDIVHFYFNFENLHLHLF
jgi:hypothetical protein